MRRAAIEITHRAIRADGDLIIRVSLCLDEQLDCITIPQGAVVFFHRADVWLLAGMFLAADGEAEIIAEPCGLHGGAKDGLAPGLQLAQLHRGGGKGFHPRVFIEFAVDHDLLTRRPDEPEDRQRTAQTAELLALVAQALEIAVNEPKTFAENTRGVGFQFCPVEQCERRFGFVFFLFHRLPVGLAVVKERIHFGLGRAVKKAHILAEHRIHAGVPAAPVHALGEIDRKMIVAHVLLVDLLADAQPDVLALGNALGGVDSRAE